MRSRSHCIWVALCNHNTYHCVCKYHNHFSLIFFIIQKNNGLISILKYSRSICDSWYDIVTVRIQHDLPWCTRVCRLSSLLQLIQSQTDCWEELSVATMFLLLTLVLYLTGLSPVTSHSVHSGQCPDLSPMSGFDWDQVSLMMWSTWGQEQWVINVFSFPLVCGTSRKNLTPSPPVWHTSSRQTTSASSLLSR